MDKHIVQLSNGWMAEFANHGEFRMASEGWGMLLLGPAERCIRYFENEIVLVNDESGSQAHSCIQLSSDGKYGYLRTGLDFAWVIDFDKCMIAPHRVYISHHNGGKYVSAYEQPAYRKTQEYVTVAGKLVYITFPFCSDNDFPRVWTEYLETRKKQLDDTYFNA